MDRKSHQLSPAEWEHVKDVLDRASLLEPEKRPAFVSSSTLTVKLKAEAISLLGNTNAVEDFLTVPAGAFVHDLFVGPAVERSCIGDRVGVYELISLIGHGGMGTVYLAERRDDKFDQRVAVKILNRELNNSVLRDRYDREVLIQSKLIHPNIVTILDAGTTDDDLPYIVMEFIEGVPIDRYCAEASLDLRSVLKLFNKVCEAVAYAHRSLIVHRDIKPGNIIVTNDGIPKLLDFGISELISADDDENLRGSIAGLTPNYSSPEQLAGEDSGISTDVYSLGIILFKLLTGELPSAEWISGESNATVLSTEADAKILRTELPTDLKCIVKKAIKKNVADRYQTADQISADIWRFMDGQPVQARPNTRSYQLLKFVLRRRFAVTAGTIILISMIVGTAAAVWQSQIARAQAAAANAEQAKSEKISKFMMKVLSYANPSWWAAGNKYGGQARVIDVMKELEAEIDTEFAGEADVQAELHYKFAEAYSSHGGDEFRASAHRHALRALELRRQFYGDYHELVAKDMVYVYWTSEKITDNEVKMLADAIGMMRNTNPANRNLPFMLEDYGARLFDDTKPERAETYYRLAPETSLMNRYELADRYFVEMLELLRLHYAENEKPIIFNKCALAMTKAKTGHFDEAQNYYNICKEAYDSFPADAADGGWEARLKAAESLLKARPSQ